MNAPKTITLIDNAHQSKMYAKPLPRENNRRYQSRQNDNSDRYYQKSAGMGSERNYNNAQKQKSDYKRLSPRRHYHAHSNWMSNSEIIVSHKDDWDSYEVLSQAFPMAKTFRAGIVAVNDDKKMLLVKERNRTKIDGTNASIIPGYIGPVKGSRSAGDRTARETALREWEEETKYPLTVDRLFPRPIIIARPDTCEVFVYYFARVPNNADTEIELDRRELEYHQWVTIYEARTLQDVSQTTKKLLELAINIKQLTQDL